MKTESTFDAKRFFSNIFATVAFGRSVEDKREKNLDGLTYLQSIADILKVLKILTKPMLVINLFLNQTFELGVGAD